MLEIEFGAFEDYFCVLFNSVWLILVCGSQKQLPMQIEIYGNNNFKNAFHYQCLVRYHAF